MDKLVNLIREKMTNLPENFVSLLELLLITDCENFKKEKFKLILSLYKENKDISFKNDYEAIFLLIFLLGINKDFNTELLALLKSIIFI